MHFEDCCLALFGKPRSDLPWSSSSYWADVSFPLLVRQIPLGYRFGIVNPQNEDATDSERRAVIFYAVDEEPNAN